jgi:hypothetical protein
MQGLKALHLFHKYLIPHHQVTRQRNPLRLSAQAIDIIVPGNVVVKLTHKRTSDASTFLVDAVEPTSIASELDSAK